jgi:hypothetical protein
MTNEIVLMDKLQVIIMDSAVVFENYRKEYILE